MAYPGAVPEDSVDEGGEFARIPIEESCPSGWAEGGKGSSKEMLME